MSEFFASTPTYVNHQMVNGLLITTVGMANIGRAEISQRPLQPARADLVTFGVFERKYMGSGLDARLFEDMLQVAGANASHLKALINNKWGAGLLRLLPPNTLRFEEILPAQPGGGIPFNVALPRTTRAHDLMERLASPGDEPKAAYLVSIKL